VRITAANSQHLYWTAAQMLVSSHERRLQPTRRRLIRLGHHLEASDGSGSLLELSKGGANPIVLSNGERRTFLLDGDEIVIKAVLIDRDSHRSVSASVEVSCAAS